MLTVDSLDIGKAYSDAMGKKHSLSGKPNHRRLTKQQEAFCELVALGTPPTEPFENIYPDNSALSCQAGELMLSEKVTNRIQALEEQRDRIRELNRDSLTIKALDVADDARADGKYSASVSGLRLEADLQGLTWSNPVAEASLRFMKFLAGTDSGQPDIEAEARALAEDDMGGS